MLSDTEFKPILLADDDIDPDAAVLDDDALPEAIDPLETDDDDLMGWKAPVTDDDDAI